MAGWAASSSTSAKADENTEGQENTWSHFPAPQGPPETPEPAAVSAGTTPPRPRWGDVKLKAKDDLWNGPAWSKAPQPQGPVWSKAPQPQTLTPRWMVKAPWRQHDAFNTPANSESEA